MPVPQPAANPPPLPPAPAQNTPQPDSVNDTIAAARVVLRQGRNMRLRRRAGHAADAATVRLHRRWIILDCMASGISGSEGQRHERGRLLDDFCRFGLCKNTRRPAQFSL